MSSYAYSSTASSSTSGVLIILLFIVAIVVLVAWLVATKMFIDLAQKTRGFIGRGYCGLSAFSQHRLSSVCMYVR